MARRAVQGSLSTYIKQLCQQGHTSLPRHPVCKCQIDKISAPLDAKQRPIRHPWTAPWTAITQVQLGFRVGFRQVDMPVPSTACASKATYKHGHAFLNFNMAFSGWYNKPPVSKPVVSILALAICVMQLLSNLPSISYPWLIHASPQVCDSSPSNP